MHLQCLKNKCNFSSFETPISTLILSLPSDHRNCLRPHSGRQRWRTHTRRRARAASSSRPRVAPIARYWCALWRSRRCFSRRAWRWMRRGCRESWSRRRLRIMRLPVRLSMGRPMRRHRLVVSQCHSNRSEGLGLPSRRMTMTSSMPRRQHQLRARAGVAIIATRPLRPMLRLRPA
jgi:hypothetical protein